MAKEHLHEIKGLLWLILAVVADHTLALFLAGFVAFSHLFASWYSARKGA